MRHSRHAYGFGRRISMLTGPGAASADGLEPGAGVQWAASRQPAPALGGGGRGESDTAWGRKMEAVIEARVLAENCPVRPRPELRRR